MFDPEMKAKDICHLVDVQRPDDFCRFAKVGEIDVYGINRFGAIAKRVTF